MARRPKRKQQRRQKRRSERLGRARSHFDAFDTEDAVLWRWADEFETDVADGTAVHRHAGTLADAVMDDSGLSMLRFDRAAAAEASEEYLASRADESEGDEVTFSLPELQRYVAFKLATPEFVEDAQRTLRDFIQKHRNSAALVKAGLRGLFLCEHAREADDMNEPNPLGELLAGLALADESAPPSVSKTGSDASAALLPGGVLSGMLDYLTDSIPEDAPPLEVLSHAIRFEQMWHFAEGMAPLAQRFAKAERLSRNQYKKLAAGLDALCEEALPKDLTWETLDESRLRLRELADSKDQDVTREQREAAQAFLSALEPTEQEPWEKADLVSAFLRAVWCYTADPPAEEYEAAAQILDAPHETEGRLRFVRMLLDARDTVRARRALMFLLDGEEAGWTAKSLMARACEIEKDWQDAQQWLVRAVEEAGQDESVTEADREGLAARERRIGLRLKMQSLKFW